MKPQGGLLAVGVRRGVMGEDSRGIIGLLGAAASGRRDLAGCQCRYRLNMLIIVCYILNGDFIRSV